MSYDPTTVVLLAMILIERSPDHWWVTTLRLPSVVLPLNWKVTRSLVSYDDSDTTFAKVGLLKGHQIIGELRLWATSFLPSADNWKVTRSLVSYDQTLKPELSFLWLKGHQIIGELRPSILVISFLASIERSPDHWWVTTFFFSLLFSFFIERSPDHWWVTTWG
mgnify:CR=1 FL=1